MASDKELLDFLEELNAKKHYTGRCILRMSETNRGWRLHETDLDDASDTVRGAILKFKAQLEKAKAGKG